MTSIRKLRWVYRRCMDMYSRVFFLMILDQRIRDRQRKQAARAMQRYRRRQKRRQAASTRKSRLILIQNVNVYMYMNGVPHLIGHADKATIRTKGSR